MKKPLSLEAKLKKLAHLEEKKKIVEGLPHLHSFKFYPWARTVWDSTNRFNFLCGPNQCSKSSLLIRKCIHWATETKLWPKLWRTNPITFWYLYPSQDIINTEVRNKWVREFLPRNEYKDHPVYGWQIKEQKGDIDHIVFNSGVLVYFKSYTQKVQHLQAGTCHAIFADEEIPIEVWPEIKSRLSATHGYYTAAFTATIGADYWRQVLEDHSSNNPLPDALKLQISLYDCQHYEDGTPSFWTDKKIEEEIRLCPNDREVQRRVYGKFVKAEGLKYPSFDRIRNVVPPAGPHGVPPPEWNIYAGVDIGSGSPTSGHPSAIIFIAVRPDFRFGRVFKSWVGKGIITTAADTLRIFQELRGEMRCVMQVYDYSARDFYTIASRAGESFFPADKTVDVGENNLNSLFKNLMLQIDDIPDNQELIRQLEGLYIGEKKSKSVDDLVDAVRYAALAVPWDWTMAGLDMQAKPKVREKTEEQKRREFVFGLDGDADTIFEEEIAEWNSYMDVN